MSGVERVEGSVAARPRSGVRAVAEVAAVVVLLEVVRWAVGPLVLGGLFINLLEPVARLFAAPLDHGQITWGGTEVVPIVILLVLVAVTEGGSPWQLAHRVGLIQPLRAILGSVMSIAPLLAAVALAAAPLNRAVVTWASVPHMAAVLLSALFTALLYQGYAHGRLHRRTGWPWLRSGLAVTLIGVAVAVPSRLRPHLGVAGPSLRSVVLGTVFSLLLAGGLSAIFAVTEGDVFACVAAGFIWLVVIGAPAPARLAVLVGGAVSAAALAASVAAAKARPRQPATRA